MDHKLLNSNSVVGRMLSTVEATVRVALGITLIMEELDFVQGAT